MPAHAEETYYSALTGGRFPVAISLARHDMALAEAAKDAGADALKLHLNAYHRASGTGFGTFAEERPFFEEVATLGLPLLVMAGQQTVPGPQELEELRSLGVEGFNIYFDHMQPHLLQSSLRPMPAMADSSSDDDLDRMNDLDGAVIEASVTAFADYGEPLTPEDVERYRHIASRSRVPVIAPSQKRFVPADMADLRDAGLSGVLLGVIVTGETSASLKAAVRPIVDVIAENKVQLAR